MNLKEEIEDILHPENKMLNIAKERLHPPMAPIASEKTVIANKLGADVLSHKQYKVESTDVDASTTASKLSIDFSYLTNNSSFQRAIIEFIRKYIPGFETVNPRASKDVMTKSFNKNIANYKEVMAELKLKLKEKRLG